MKGLFLAFFSLVLEAEGAVAAAAAQCVLHERIFSTTPKETLPTCAGGE